MAAAVIGQLLDGSIAGRLDARPKRIYVGACGGLPES